MERFVDSCSTPNWPHTVENIAQGEGIDLAKDNHRKKAGLDLAVDMHHMEAGFDSVEDIRHMEADLDLVEDTRRMEADLDLGLDSGRNMAVGSGSYCPKESSVEWSLESLGDWRLWELSGG